MFEVPIDRVAKILSTFRVVGFAQAADLSGCTRQCLLVSFHDLVQEVVEVPRKTEKNKSQISHMTISKTSARGNS